MAKKKTTQEEALSQEETQELINSMESDSESDDGNSNTIRIIIGPFSKFGDTRKWHISSGKYEWNWGVVGRVKSKVDGLYYESYPGEYHFPSLAEAAADLTKYIQRNLGDFHFDSSDDDYFDKLKLFAEVMNGVAIELNRALSPFGIMMHYNLPLMQKRIGNVQSKLNKRYLKGYTGKDLVP